MYNYSTIEYFDYRGDTYFYYTLVPRITSLKDLSHTFLDDSTYIKNVLPLYSDLDSFYLQYRINSIHETQHGHLALHAFKEGDHYLEIFDSLGGSKMKTIPIPPGDNLWHFSVLTASHLYQFNSTEGRILKYRYAY